MTPPPRSSRLDALSDRERQVLDLIAAGRTSAQIGRVLFVSPYTVNKHVENIRAKLGVHTRAEAVALHTAATLAEDDTDPLPRPR